MAESTDRSFLDGAVLARLRALPLCARLPMLGSVSGRHRSPVRGSSLEFSEYRKYVPGDDKRRLDWRAYGRSDRYYIREFEADTNLRLCLVVDGSGSMGFSGSGPEKMLYAKQLAGTLACLAASQGDAVGLYVAGSDLRREIRPKRGAGHLRKVLDEIGRLEPSGPTGLVECLHAAAEKISQRALVVIISDCFVPPDVLGTALQHLRFRKHDTSLLHLLDPREVTFDCERTTRFVDMEGHVTVVADPEVVRKDYLKSLQRHLAAIDELVRQSHVDYHRITTDVEYSSVLSEFLLRRRPKGVRA